MRRLTIIAPLLLALMGAGFATPVEWAPKSFPISFWCGPPDPYITVERYRQVSDAGFNYVMPPCEGKSSAERNLRILDTAKSVKLKAFLQDDRMPAAISGVSDAKTRIDSIVVAYAKHPAFAGYFITDEPGAGAFHGLSEVVAYLREKDPAHPAYINLFPNYASEDQLGAATYDTYVSQFIKTVKPFAVSYDHYHFLKSGDRTGFFANLDSVRTLALAEELPFWQIVLSVPFADYRPLSESEKRWEAMQTLAYGAKGLLYFTYWTPGDKSYEWGPALIGRDANPTPQYEEVKRINSDVQALGKYLIDAVPSSVFQAGKISPGGKPREAGTPVSVSGAGDLTVGLFRRDTHLYVMIANRDYRKPASTDVLFTNGELVIQRLDKSNGKWLAVKGVKTEDNEFKTRVELAPADGELYRW